MTTFFKKYWLGALLFLAWGFIVVYFNPRQRQFYLDADIVQFKKTAHLALIILEICFAGFILALALKRNSNRNQIIRISLSLIFGLVVFYIFFQSTFTSIGLFINRQTAGNDIKRNYVIQYLVGGTKDKNDFFLYDIDKKHIITEQKLLDPVYTFGFNQNDTIYINLTKGLLGIEYFKTIIAAKK